VEAATVPAESAERIDIEKVFYELLLESKTKLGRGSADPDEPEGRQTEQVRFLGSLKQVLEISCFLAIREVDSCCSCEILGMICCGGAKKLSGVLGAESLGRCLGQFVFLP